MICWGESYVVGHNGWITRERRILLFDSKHVMQDGLKCSIEITLLCLLSALQGIESHIVNSIQRSLTSPIRVLLCIKDILVSSKVVP